MTDGNWKKLTPEDVAEIRIRSAAGTRKSVLAREYRVAQSTLRYHTLHGKAGVTPFARLLADASATHTTPPTTCAKRRMPC